MVTHSSNNPHEKSGELLQFNENTASLEANQPTQIRIRIRIPKQYNDEPIISQLISQHGVTVNIAAALLGANARDDGWFDLELRGTTVQIQSALTYLKEKDLEIWSEADTGDDRW